MPKVLATLVGRKFGRLEVLAQAERPPGKTGRHWRCRCDCGTVRVVRGVALTKSHRPSRSCGCAAIQASKQRAKHGHATTRVYRIYIGMLGRCYRPGATHWARYGGRGIGVHANWLGPAGFQNFLRDVGEPPTDQHTLDRRKNDEDYSAQNCRWATRREQANNRGNNRRITFDGRTQSLAEWCREFQLARGTVDKRLRVGKPLEEVFAPVQRTGAR